MRRDQTETRGDRVEEEEYDDAPKPPQINSVPMVNLER